MAKQAAAVATKAVASLAGGGIFGVELFAMPDGSVLVSLTWSTPTPNTFTL